MSKHVGVYIIKSDTLVMYNCVLVFCNKALVDYFQLCVLKEKLEKYLKRIVLLFFKYAKERRILVSRNTTVCMC